MQADEAQYEPSQTQAHMTPIIRQITQLSISDQGSIQMPSVCAACARMMAAVEASAELLGNVQAEEKSSIVVASRPKQPGTLGKAVKLVTNFYSTNFNKVPPLLHHDIRVERVRFNPETGALRSLTWAVFPVYVPLGCPMQAVGCD
jgi:hypothetical protein